MHKLEYLWLDGCTPTQIRHKTKVVKDFEGDNTEYQVKEVKETKILKILE